MKYYFFITVFLFGSFFVIQNSSANYKDVVINEIGAYPTSTHEWVEIWNKGSDPIDIKDWKFWENNINHGLKPTTSSDSIVSTGEYAVICQNSETFLKDYPNFIGSVFDSSWVSLSENGEEIGLKDENDNFVEQFVYVSTTKYSLERKNPLINIYNLENWQENNNGNTVGFQNSNYLAVDESVSSTITTSSENSTILDITSSSSKKHVDWSFVRLNEIITDPISGNEIVELYNSSPSSSFDLSGGYICDSSGENCKILSGIINSRDWLVADLLTDRYLNNSGDTVFLKDDNNNNIDQVEYGNEGLNAPEKGQSLMRKQDGIDTDTNNDWVITNKITSGLENEFIAPPTAVVDSGGNAAIYFSDTNNTINTSSSKSNKISTTTKQKTELKDTVNISWKLDWPYGLDIGEGGFFDSRGSADPRGGDIDFLWNFGDKSISTGDNIFHVFATSGTYTVLVSASSTAGTFGKKEFKVYVGSSFSVALSNIKIDDFQVTSTDNSLEYILLKNYLNKPQNVSGWKLKNKSGKEYELPENTIIAASGTLKFFRSVHHLNFDKDGDAILLTSPNDKEVHKVILFSEKKIVKKDVKISSLKGNSNWLSVRGVVTVEPKTFGQQIFYISDGQKGFQIYQYKKDFPDLKIGDEIVVGGEVSETGGAKRIKIKNRNSINVLSSKKILEPINLLLEDVEEDMLGSLVKISGDITEIKSNLMYVDDGNTEIAVYFKKGAKIDKQEIKEGDKVEIIGILNQNKNGWQVLPRSLSDINIIGHVDDVLNDRLLLDQEKKVENNKKYITTTIGGLSAVLLGFLARARGALLVVGVKKITGMISNFVGRG